MSVRCGGGHGTDMPRAGMCTKAAHLINICVYANKCIGHETAYWLGCGGRRLAYCRRCVGGDRQGAGSESDCHESISHLRTTGPGPRTTLDLTHVLEFCRSHGLL